MPLNFEPHKDGLQIFIHGRDKAVGEIQPWGRGWFGYIRVLGLRPMMLHDDRNTIADALSAWEAAGMPRDSVLLKKPDRNTGKAGAYFEMRALLTADV
jgi:hypothetical protein